MAKPSCDVFLNYVPSPLELEDLRSIYIINFIFNTFLSYTAVALNVITIFAITKTRALPKPLKTLLLNLAASDIGVGLLVQPFYCALLVKWLHSSSPGCMGYNAFFVVMSFFAISSFFGVFVVSLDRFLAISLHLRYRQVVTPGRVACAVITLWSLSGFVALFTAWYPHDSSLIILILGTVCLFITSMIYAKIYLVFRRHRIQIQGTLQLERASSIAGSDNNDTAIFANFKKSAVGVFYVYIVFMACYLPRGCNLFIIVIAEQSTGMKGFALFAWTVMLLNSSLNPVIYCLKMRHIRQAVVDILRNMSWPWHC